MQELAQQLMRAADGLTHPSRHEDLGSGFAEIQAASEKWAAFALRNLTGAHLRAALGISEAMAAFVTVELEVRHGR